MRVLQIGKFYPPQRGGMETVLRDLSFGLVSRRHEVRVLVAAPARQASREDLDDVDVERVANWGTLRSLPVCPSLPSALRTALHEFQPDVVHLHLPHPLAVLAWQWARSDVPLVVSYHSDIVRQRWLGPLWSPLRAKTLRRAAAIHVTSESLRDQSRALAGVRERCHVIPLAVDLDYFAHPSPLKVQEWNQRFGSRFFLFVGRLVYYKGVDVLLEALRETVIPVVIAGEGPMRREWETLARVLGLESQVHFVGEVSDASRLALYHAAAGFVLPSTEASETFGVVQLEAMASGLPVVACRASEGVASVHVDGESGILVPPKDPAALRRALVGLWDDSPRSAALGQAGLRRAQAFFSLNRMIDRFEEILDQVATGRSTAP